MSSASGCCSHLPTVTFKAVNVFSKRTSFAGYTREDREDVEDSSVGVGQLRLDEVAADLLWGMVELDGAILFSKSSRFFRVKDCTGVIDL